MSRHMTTERLTLRPFQRSDAERLAKLVNDIEIARWIGPMPHPYTLAMAHEYLDTTLEDEGTFALEQDGTLVGAVGVGKILGFWLARSHWGQGLMTEACTCLITHYFVSDNISLVSGYHDGNDQSRRVHEKLGFRSNGTSYVFSQALQTDVLRHDLILTASDWQARQ